MRAGDFDRAWRISDDDLRDYLGSPPAKHTGERHMQRIWRGEPLTGKRVLVRCYHGLGDTIQFVRFAPALRRVAREVIFWVQPALMSLVGTVEGVDRVLPLHDGTPDADFDVDIEVMELAHALRATPGMISGCVPYLRVPDNSVRVPAAVKRIGLVWEVGEWDKRRSVPPELLGALGAVSGVQLLSLQMGPGRTAASRIPAIDIAEPDVAALAAAVLQLDLVVTVDTMVAHLCGAMRAPVWTMLHAECDWRWPRHDSNSIWYPTMRLFHQHSAGDWAPVVAEMAKALSQGGLHRSATHLEQQAHVNS